MTDHGNMFAGAEFFRRSRSSSVKPIIGIEAYLAPGSRHYKKPTFWGSESQRGVDEFGEGGDVSGAGAYTHTARSALQASASSSPPASLATTSYPAPAVAWVSRRDHGWSLTLTAERGRDPRRGETPRRI
jgi:hypothetical protein